MLPKCSRLIDDGRPEEIVFVSCSPKQGLVVHLVANESIWKKLHSDGFEAATNVEVKRTEVGLSVADWRLLHDVLLKLLPLAKTDDDPRQRELGEDYYFSTCRNPSWMHGWCCEDASGGLAGCSVGGYCQAVGAGFGCSETTEGGAGIGGALEGQAAFEMAGEDGDVSRRNAVTWGCRADDSRLREQDEN